MVAESIYAQLCPLTGITPLRCRKKVFFHVETFSKEAQPFNTVIQEANKSNF